MNNVQISTCSTVFILYEFCPIERFDRTNVNEREFWEILRGAVASNNSNPS